jgi:hypothetical protein
MRSAFRAAFVLAAGGASYQGPFVVPPYWDDVAPPQPATAIALYVPGVVAPATPDGPLSLPGVQLFAVSVTTGQLGKTAAVTVPTTAVLPPGDTDPIVIPDEVYDALFADFVALRSALDAQETEGALLPRGAQTLCARIASNLPLRIDQWLRFQVVFESSRRWLDVWPGMRAVLEPAGFSLYNAFNQGLLETWSAFVGGADLCAGRTASGAVSLSPFLRGINRYSPIGTPWVPDMYGGYLDFGTGAIEHAHVRLIYPPEIDPVNPQKLLGTPSFKQSVVLVSAQSYAQVIEATDAVLNKQKDPPAGTHRVFLSGRSGLSVQIAITVSGAARWVELGTTLRDLLSQELVAVNQDLYAAIADEWLSVSVLRWSQPSLLERTQFDAKLRYQPFLLTLPAAVPDGWPEPWIDALDLPLQIGDRVEIAPGSGVPPSARGEL